MDYEECDIYHEPVLNEEEREDAEGYWDNYNGEEGWSYDEGDYNT